MTFIKRVGKFAIYRSKISGVYIAFITADVRDFGIEFSEAQHQDNSLQALEDWCEL